MKVLQVNSVYRSGSTGKITYDIHRELLSRGEGSVVCYGRGERVREPHVYKICGELYSKVNNLRSRLTGMMYGGCLLSTNRLIRIMWNRKWVYLQIINHKWFIFLNFMKNPLWNLSKCIGTHHGIHGSGGSIDWNAVFS